jgi:Family of unknown function (DUF6247)
VSHRALPGPACTPAAVRALLAANSDASTLAQYDADLDAAYEQARANGDLTPLTQTVRRWWFDPDAWRDPAAHRVYLDRLERYLADGPPLQEQRVSRTQIRERYGE